ncbi:MAG TPA: DUF5343 domain-containing protein [Nitrososphaerales archaeon]|nr:DUF5343 domain-containing protein [Nitrososphaerales archaeon]
MEELKLVDRNGIEVESGQEEITSERSSQRRNPPARNTSRFWFERFLSVIQRQNPQVIDSAFLSQIAPSNEGKLLAQLKFLHVIDDQGRPTKLLPSLNMVGDEQKRGFFEIAKESYGDLIGEVKVERAVPEDVVNYFIRRYAFTRDKAVNASRFFLYLAEKSSMPVSSELSSFLVEKERATGSTGSVSRAQEKSQRNSQSRPFARPSVQRKGYESGDPVISATINITLTKDTPKEYWDRVLALLGERRDAVSDALEVQEQSIGMQSPE